MEPTASAELNTKKEPYYYRHTLLLDLEEPDDIRIQEWLLARKNRKTSYSGLIKKALLAMMAETE